MQEIVRINLDNEMDLILAHKRTLKLAELCGITLSSQTTFATAVSEIARCAITHGKKSYLVLSIHMMHGNKKEITACLFDIVDLSAVVSDALSYAKKLMGNLHISQVDGLYTIRINHAINFSGTISPAKIESFKEYFRKEPPLSAYDEIRKKNIQLIDLSNKLRESESQYRMLTDTMPLMVFAFNQKGEITFTNKRFNDFIGAQTPPVNAVQLWQTMIHPDDYKNIVQEWERSVHYKTKFSTQGRIRHNNQYIWHLVSITPGKVDQTGANNWIGLFVDIQVQKQIEETRKDNDELKMAKIELEQYQLMLERKISELNRSNHDLEQFAYIASHDLQEPLRKIMTFADLMQKNLEDEELTKKYFGKINSSARHMTELIKAVLNYSRLSKTGEQFYTVDLNAVIENVKNDFELLITEKNAEIIYDKLPVVNGIPLQLHQLFLNLVSNALKFSDKKPVISITSRIVPSSSIENHWDIKPVDDYVELLFQDNGIGFEQRFARQIFTIFQRLHDKRTFNGTGIGLALCKKIVDNHQGHISAKSEPGKGTSFYIYLPVLSI